MYFKTMIETLSWFKNCSFKAKQNTRDVLRHHLNYTFSPPKGCKVITEQISNNNLSKSFSFM